MSLLFNPTTAVILVVIAGILVALSQYINYTVQKGDRNNVAQAVAPKVRSLISIPSTQLLTMHHFLVVENKYLEGIPEINSEEDVRGFLTALPRLSEVNHNLHGRTYRGWPEYMYHYSLDTKEYIRQIYQFAPYLDTELIVILGEIEESQYFSALSNMYSETQLEYELGYISPFFYDYLQKVGKLKEYYDDNLKEYDASASSK